MTNFIEQHYQCFLDGLLAGERKQCNQLVAMLQEKVTVEDLYFDLIQPSLYEIGRLWEENKISIAHEHIATAIVEGVLNQIFASLDAGEPNGRRLVMACPEDEHHQVGPKIIADYFEYRGWRTYFVGANTPIQALLETLEPIKPDLLGLSLSIYEHVDSMLSSIAAVNQRYPTLEMIVGGRGLVGAPNDLFAAVKNVTLLPDVDAVKRYLSGRLC